MFLEREDRRREREQLYRQQLRQEIDEKNERKKSNQPSENREVFSLIKNIEAEQQKRKNKQRQYYAQLEQQRINQINRKKAEKKRKQLEELEEQRKIKQENEQMRRRFEEEKRRQEEKKINQIRSNEIRDYPPQKAPEYSSKKQKQKPSSPWVQGQEPLDQIDLLRKGPNKPKEEQVDISRQIYGNRVENQEFYFPERRNFSNQFYKQLQYERRNFEQQTRMLSELNQILNREKAKPRRNPGRQLQDLRQLDKFLNEQSKTYLNNAYNSKLNESKRSKTLQIQGSNSTYNFL